MKNHKQRVSRREFLKLSADAVAASIGSPESVSSSRIPTGVQLYCVREELKTGMPGVLARLAEMGYEGVEYADYYDHTAGELRTMLDDAGLEPCGSHIYLDTLLGEELERTIEFHQTLKNNYLIVRSMGEELHDTEEALLRTCETFNEVAASLRPHGMKVGYHNHGYIFDRYNDGGETKWNILADNTDDDVVLQLDTGNASSRADVIELLRRNPGRHHTMHIKPYDPNNEDAFLGDDQLDWPTILNIAETSGGIEWYIVEYEREAFPPLEALQTNLENFGKIRAA